MTRSFARRLTTQSAVTIGGSLAAVIAAVAFVLFSSYVRGLNAQSAAVMARIPEIIRLYHVPANNPAAAVDAVSAHVDHPRLQIRAANDRLRVIALPSSLNLTASSERVYQQPRAEPEFQRTALGHRLTFALATALGLQAVHARIAEMDITVSADEGMLETTLRQYAIGMATLLLAIGLFAYFAARVLAREALRPLNEVVTALETFAAGNLHPRQLHLAGAEQEFARLAMAYNGAVERVATAFSERDRAEAQIRRFIADAAHQLRTPLTVIQGFIGILTKPKTDAERARILQTMDRQSRHMASLIEKLMLLERWEEEDVNLELLNIGDCVRAVVAPFAAASPDRDFVLSMEPGCYASVDSGEIKEALGNIVDNAVKYAVLEPISISVAGGDGDVTIVVADRGPGLSQTDREHAFDRFYRGTKRSVVGSGLGLSIAKRAVERSSGRIWIESAYDRGTAFVIRLPRVTSKHAVLAGSESLE
jgi:signal transduction histidine kinase